ncbi:MAG: hypothetical protein M3N43_08210 [Actinomycetota bacterium]|nr:hypothetical protein [Actinomycetota bacterium]
MSIQFQEVLPYNELDLEFAGRAVIYLEKSGLDADEVVDCLMDEFDLDRVTAVELASLAA